VLRNILAKNLHHGLVRFLDSGLGKVLCVEEKHLVVIALEVHNTARIARVSGVSGRLVRQLASFFPWAGWILV
jgi:hypothetical protein